MIPRNIGGYILPAVGVAAQSSTGATIKGTAIDRTQGSPASYGSLGQIVQGGLALSATIFGQVGAVSGAPSAVSVEYKLQDSVDTTDGDFADSTDSQGNYFNFTLTAASSSGRVDIDMTGLKRYVRVVAIVTLTGGTSPAALVGADLILGGISEGPQNYS